MGGNQNIKSLDRDHTSLVVASVPPTSQNSCLPKHIFIVFLSLLCDSAIRASLRLLANGLCCDEDEEGEFLDELDVRPLLQLQKTILLPTSPTTTTAATTEFTPGVNFTNII